MDKIKYEIIFELKNAKGVTIDGPLELRLADALCRVIDQGATVTDYAGQYLAEDLAYIKKHIGRFSLTSSVVRGEE
jgi:hypothetical protein